MEIPETEFIFSNGDGAELVRTVLRPGDYIIGRNADCDLHVEADLVSRRHARLTINFDHLLLEDLGSSNGTFVNGEPITEATRLWPNQKVNIGSTTLEFRRVKTFAPPGVSLAPTTAAVKRLVPEEFLRDKKYEIGGVVAQGGMGSILDAREVAIERTVAMKVMLSGWSPDDLTRFVAEAKITGRLEHPNIVPVHELGVDENNQVFYTMKFVRGVTMNAVLERLASGDAGTIRKYPLGALLTIFQKVCDAVAFAHSKGVIHRDIKPENIMLGDFGEVLVMDWGLAKVLGERPAEDAGVERSFIRIAADPTGFGSTLSGTTMGTPHYMAPEQARGEVEMLDARADIYSLGATLFQILSLRKSVEGDSPMAVVAKVARGEIEPLLGAAGGGAPALRHLPGGRIPESLAAVVRKAMAFDKPQRYAGVAELQADITAYQNGFATSAEHASFVKQVLLLIQRNKGVFATGFAAWFIITALAVWFVVSLRTSERKATAALEKLQATAPTFFAQANDLVDKRQFTDALAKISYACALSPDEADYWFVKGNILESLFRLGEAREAYQEALRRNPAHAFAQENLKLCEEILAAEDDPDELSEASRNKLAAVMRKENRAAEAVALIAGVGKDHRALEATWRLALKKAIPRFTSKWLTLDQDGLFTLNLPSGAVTDLSFLRGMPIKKLDLTKNDVSDLSPLAELPLQVLDLSFTLVTDLAPLRGLKLTSLHLGATKVMDLAALKDMPLKELILNGSSVTDLSALKGIKLEKLTLTHCSVTDLTPLKGLPLKELYLPDGVRHVDALSGMPLVSLTMPNSVTDLRPLTGMPLKRLYILHIVNRPTPMDLSPLAGMHLEYITLNLTSVSDLSPLRGQPIDSAALAQIPAKDFSVLASWPLKGSLNLGGDKAFADLPILRGKGPFEDLRLNGTGVTDITPLRGMTIKRLWLADIGVTDLHPIAEIQGLEELTIPAGATDIEFLRRLSNIKRLDRSPNEPRLSAVEFWKEYDAQQAAGRK